MRIINGIIEGQLKEQKLINTKIQVIDTTAMPKNITYPTNSKLLHKVRARG